MLSIQLWSIQIDITWSKKSITKNKLERQIHANEIEKKLNEMKNIYLEYMRYM